MAGQNDDSTIDAELEQFNNNPNGDGNNNLLSRTP
jgi:hypothetical protein